MRVANDICDYDIARVGLMVRHRHERAAARIQRASAGAGASLFDFVALPFATVTAEKIGMKMHRCGVSLGVAMRVREHCWSKQQCYRRQKCSENPEIHKAGGIFGEDLDIRWTAGRAGTSLSDWLR